MSANNIGEDEDSNSNNVLICFEQQFRQLLLESKANELNTKTTQEKLNNCLKQNILLKHELEAEHLNKSLIQMELDTLTTLMNTSYNTNNNSSSSDMNMLINDHVYLTNKLNEIQVENKELKHQLTISNSKIFSLMENQSKYLEKINLVSSTLNSSKIQINKLEKESHTLINMLCASKDLARQILIALEYSKKLNKTQFDHIEKLIKEVANIKSKLYMFIDLNNEQETIDTDNKNMISSNQNETQLEICQKLFTILEIENNRLHESIKQMVKIQKPQDDI